MQNGIPSYLYNLPIHQVYADCAFLRVPGKFRYTFMSSDWVFHILSYLPTLCEN
jgi:hypothetical protein